MRINRSTPNLGLEISTSLKTLSIKLRWLDVAAGTLGVKWVERHFTLDRTLKGTDHAASLEPDGARRIKRDLELLIQSLKYKKKEILDSELAQRKKLKFSNN